MTNIISFPGKPSEARKFCFTCGCGHQTFVLRPDARIECGHCEATQDRLLWGQYFTSPNGLIDSTPIPSSTE